MIQNFSQLNKYLQQFIPGSIKNGDFYNPDKMYEILPLLGNPQEKFKVVHVAGTSGKTSTCYYIAAMLRTIGVKVGLSVSPHVFEINERVQVNGEPLVEKEMCKLFSEFIAIDGLVELKPTYFELLVSFAFWVFAKNGCEYVVSEVGLGGLKDATNVITNPDKVCVITDIGLDHTHILGETIEKIATQKAGIIRTKNHVFCYEQGEVVDHVIDQQVVSMEATLHRLSPEELAKNTSFLDWLPDYQKRNWLLSRAVASYVLNRDGRKNQADKLLKTQSLTVPARMQTIKLPGKILILDGAHNSQKLGALVGSLQALYPDKTFALLVAFMESKKATLYESLNKLHELSDNIIATEFTASSDLPYKVMQADELAQVIADADFKIVKEIPDNENALDELLEQNVDIVLITGSFYLISSLWQKVRNYTHG